MQQKQRGFTMMELLVTIAIMTVVMSLLVFPIFTAYGYIQKAQARTEARNMADIAIQKLRTDIAKADYIFDISVDGSMVAMVQGLNGETMASGGFSFVRYSLTPSDPWQAYAPFWDESTYTNAYNPNVLARLAETNLSWNDASTRAHDADYPQSTIAANPTSIQRQAFHNQMIAVTPLGERWDVPRFVATPERLVTETLDMQVDARGRRNPTQVTTRYPLIAGRNRDIDDVDSVALLPIYGVADIAALDALLPTWLPHRANPHGYQVRVYNANGNIVAGANNWNAATRVYDALLTGRHYMDWPLPALDANTPCTYDWVQADIVRQRLEGKFIFALPVTINAMTVHAGDVALPDATVLNTPWSTLPVPTGGGWDSANSYIVTRPRRITFNGDTFTLVESTPANLLANEFCFVYPDYKHLDWTDAFARENSRIVAFGAAAIPGTYTDLVNGITKYTLCDLQPDDVVVGTYSTRGVINVALTISRRDSSGGSPRERRQDYTVNMRLVARNAVKHARGSM